MGQGKQVHWTSHNKGFFLLQKDGRPFWIGDYPLDLAERGLRVQRPIWDQVSKSGGLWAATLAEQGYTCDRVPLAISEERCVNAKWCHTGCIFGAKNSLITNYLWAAENAGVRVIPNLQVEQVNQSSARPYRVG